MKLLYFVTVLILIVSCKNDQTSKASKEELKNPTVLPLELTIESRTLATVLNMELFNIYELNQKEIVQSKYSLKAEDLWYQGEFLSLLKRSRTAEPQTFGAKELISLRISFQCEDCKSAYFYKGAGNDKNIATKVKKMLKEPAAIDHEIIGDYGTFEYNSEKTILELNGFVGFYLALIDLNNELFIYEIAGVNGDATAPVFEMSEDCEANAPINKFDGLICFDAMYFEGNEVDGYYVPLKGQVYGDVASVLIEGEKISASPGDFFARIPMKLFTGYNQIPVTVTDHLGNQGESFIEIELEDVKPPAKE